MPSIYNSYRVIPASQPCLLTSLTTEQNATFKSMIRFFLSCMSTLSLLVSGFFLWRTHTIPDKLPHSIATWIAAFFGLFQDPFTGMVLFSLTLLVVLGSWFITEILLSLVYSIIASVLAFLCLLGLLSVHFPPLYQHIQAWIK